MADVARRRKRPNPYTGFGAPGDAQIGQLQEAVNSLSAQVNSSDAEDFVGGQSLTNKELTESVRELEMEVERLKRKRQPVAEEGGTTEEQRIWVTVKTFADLPSAASSPLTLLGRVDNVGNVDHGRIFRINKAENAWEEILTVVQALTYATLPAANSVPITALGRVEGVDADDGKLYKVDAAGTAWEELLTASSLAASSLYVLNGNAPSTPATITGTGGQYRIDGPSGAGDTGLQVTE